MQNQELKSIQSIKPPPINTYQKGNMFPKKEETIDIKEL